MTAAQLATGAAVVLLLAVAIAVDRVAALRLGRSMLTAGVRAVVQLAAVGVVVAVVFRTPVLAPLYLGVMLGVASWTSGRRLGRGGREMGVAAAAITSGAAATAVIVFATGALSLSARTAVPFVAQLIGGAMTATTLAGQRFVDDVATGWLEVEGWLALGATPAQAVADMGRRAAGRALVPAIDQTRSVGLVVLPGAYVGLLLGGASPLEAGRVQLLVLVGLLCAETVAVVVATRLLAPALGALRPAV
ncbi:MAG TPA: ABC transporter permease [Acidimicrobiales bacterium]|nr:ABC transporter permease [Acidimicrobiales bacterium]